MKKDCVGILCHITQWRIFRTISLLHSQRLLQKSHKSNFRPRPSVVFYLWDTPEVKLYLYLSSDRTPRNNFKKIRDLKLPLLPCSCFEVCLETILSREACSEVESLHVEILQYSESTVERQGRGSERGQCRFSCHEFYTPY